MATIIQTPAGKWQAIVRRKGHKPIKKSFTRKTDATTWCKLTEADIERGEYKPALRGSLTTFAELAKQFSTDTTPNSKARTLATLSPGQQRTAPGVLRFWCEQFGHLRLNDIDGDVIEGAIETLQQRRKLSSTGHDRGTVSLSTVKKYISLLGTVFKYATAKKLIHQSPLTNKHWPHVNDERTRYLSQAEFSALQDALEQTQCPELKPIVMLAIFTGWRKSELLGLTWQRVNLNDTAKPYQGSNKPYLIPPHSILIETSKTGEPRTVALASQAHEALLYWHQAVITKKGAEPADAELVFPSRENKNKPLDIRTPWQTTLRRAGIEHIRWHDLRHTFSSWAIMSGSNPLEVATVTGHRDLKSLKRYSHLAPEHTADVVERMANKIRGEQ